MERRCIHVNPRQLIPFQVCQSLVGLHTGPELRQTGGDTRKQHAGLEPWQRYLEAAWLDERWRDIMGTSAATRDTQIELEAAMWTLFVDASHVDGLVGAINNSGYATEVNGYLRDAEHAVTPVADGGLGYTAPGWDVIVPTNNSFPMQEFLVHAPEPGAVILLGTLVGGLGLMKFRRKRAA